MKAGKIVYGMKVSFKPVFQCDNCGRRAEGDTVTTTEIFTVPLRPYQVSPVIDAIGFSNHSMPVGWGSFYGKERGQHLCPNCCHPSGGA
jgi:hypothetical protein